ncbi:hypothetical protein CLU86_4463 [Acidovorax sp. 62]|uniref:hypothetical protein n=1 Tax=Acidovorax sp. 62 TaxID=2035203 RepID=UPI000C4AD792|nr:hypothetical protein [Acidovorax sp. 62]PIF93503.1 hypothetical protein CLU86_4463 [Acidovorax sp. 62]
MINRIKAPQIFFIALIFYFGIYSLTGFIPIAGGAGFDGSVYLDYIIKLASGLGIEKDPYRLMRISGFLPSVLAARAGLDSSGIIVFQAIFNAVSLSFAASLFFKTIESLINKNSKLIAAIATGILFFSWPFLVMPIYYPILSDHVALLFAVVSLYAWSKSYKKTLLLLIPLSVWIMPGLFVVPLMLAALPIYGTEGVLKKISPNNRWVGVFFVGLLLIVAWIFLKINNLSDAEILMHPPGEKIGMSDLRSWSLLFILIGLFFVAFIWAWISGSGLLRHIFSKKDFFLAMVFLIVGALSVHFFIDWSSGNKGPPLLYFMFLQAMAAPLKPMVSHFLHFGPIIIVAVMSCFCARSFLITDSSLPLFVAFSAYIPILILGSESRQWMPVFPLAVAFVAMNEFRLKNLSLILLFSVALCLPVFILREEVMFSVGNRLDYMSQGWQLYFGRQGPWISHRSYLIGLILMLSFLWAYVYISRRDCID